ncbi:hypothetical protein [Siminovitchia terrae]|uniref:hypothetical protein n=1 Tax=Siminovitchia terrae TaxID=1914933 RepID=UPI0028A6E890|nr:hypothetical protein [Siminovitchia terrae]
MNAYCYSIQWGCKPRLNKVKASGGCHRFSEEIYRAELDKIWAQIRQGAFDKITKLFYNSRCAMSGSSLLSISNHRLRCIESHVLSLAVPQDVAMLVHLSPLISRL